MVVHAIISQTALIRYCVLMIFVIALLARRSLKALVTLIVLLENMVFNVNEHAMPRVEEISLVIG